jgi:scyllo-inositol 2-dehydrogenase (NADP+)
MKINVGLVGFGFSGRIFHAPFIAALPEFSLKTIFTTRVSEVQATYPMAKVVDTLEQLLQDPEIDLIINTSPTENHYNVTKMALEAKKHVVVEKPFTVSSREAQELIELSEKQQKKISVYQNRRWDADFLTIQKLIKEDMLGSIQSFESNYHRYRPAIRSERWREQARPGSGILYDLGAHLIDQSLLLFGRPEKIFADIQSQKSSNPVDDYFHIILYYQKLRVHLNSQSFSDVGPRFKVVGDKATFMKWGMDVQEAQLQKGLKPTDTAFGVEAPDQWGELTEYAVEHLAKTQVSSLPGRYLEFYQKLYLSLTKNQTPPVSAESAKDVITVIEKARLSSEQSAVVSF